MPRRFQPIHQHRHQTPGQRITKIRMCGRGAAQFFAVESECGDPGERLRLKMLALAFNQRSSIPCAWPALRISTISSPVLSATEPEMIR